MGSPVEPSVHGKLPYVPALDGVRGVAVIAVLLYHQGFPWARGGFLGVSLFFTLSGYLITTLVVREHASTGGIDLRGFWGRRLRRLAPAGLLGLGAALVAIVLAVPAAQWASAIVDVRAALVQLANWRFVFAEAPYVDIGTVPSPVLHYWSLAIEEQFYLVLPVVALVTLRRSRRAFTVALLVTAAASLGLQIALPPDDRVYFGTDTRAAELAVGGLLALGWPALRERVARPAVWDAVGVAALAGTGLLWMVAEQSSRVLLGGGLTAVGVLSVAVLTGTLGGQLVPRALAARPLRWLGRLSYGLYVIHFPIFLVLSPDRTGLSGASLFLLRTGASVLIAAVSLRLIERPIREHRPVLGWSLEGLPGRVAVVAGLAALALATVPLLRAAPSVEITATGLIPVVLDRPAAVTDDDPAADPPATDAGDDGDAEDGAPVPGTDGPDGPDGGEGVATDADEGDTDASAAPDDPSRTDADVAPDEADQPSRAPRIVVVGDSTADAIGTGLQRWAEDHGGLQVSVVSSPGCAVLAGRTAQYRTGFEFTPTGCDQLFPAAVAEVARVDADALVVFLGSPQLADWRFGRDVRWRSIVEPDIGEDYREALARTLADAASAAPILWADVPVPQWDLASFGDLIGGEPPGVGPPVINQPERTHALNRLTAEVVDRTAGVSVVDFAAGLAGPDGTIAPSDRSDGLHLSEAQVRAAADTWLLPALADAHARALSELGADPDGAVSWTSHHPQRPT